MTAQGKLETDPSQGVALRMVSVSVCLWGGMA